MVPWCSGYHTRLSREGSRVQVPSEPPDGFIAQLAEHKTENLGVVGSIPTEATILLNDTNATTHIKSGSDRNLNALIAQLDRAFDYGSKGYRFESYWDHEASEFYSGAFSCFSVTNIL